jgi:hypothetical protein
VKHFASPKFWIAYEVLPVPVRKLADANYALLRRDPRHLSLQFKKVGRYCPYASAFAIARWPGRRTTVISDSGSARTPTTIK